MNARSAEITALLKAWGGGDEGALARLTEHVYPELRRMALRYMKNEGRGNTLQATALIHEVYLRLVDVTDIEWHVRAQFIAIAGQMMRRILVDAARGSRRRIRARRLEMIVSRCLEEDPVRRWQSAIELQRELAALPKLGRGGNAGTEPSRRRAPKLAPKNKVVLSDSRTGPATPYLMAFFARRCLCNWRNRRS